MIRILFSILFLFFLAACEDPLNSSSSNTPTPSMPEKTENMASPPGNEGGNGGNEIGLEFMDAANRAIQEIENDPIFFSEFNVGLMRETLKKTSILVVEYPLIVTRDGVHQESVAQNAAGKTIIFVNRFRWMAVPSAHLQEAIALHEVLGVMGIESTGVYTLSSRYMEKFLLTPQDLFNDKSKGTPLVVCSDHHRTFYSITGLGLSDLLVRIVPIGLEEKENFSHFLNNLLLEEADQIVSLSFRISVFLCSFDVRDKALINCNNGEGAFIRPTLVNVELASGALRQFWLFDLRFSILRQSSGMAAMEEPYMRFGSEGRDVLTLKTFVPPASYFIVDKHQLAPTTGETLNLSFESRTCR